MNKLILMAVCIATTACTQVQVQRLKPDTGLHHVCIENNPKVIVAEFIPVVRKGFERHGITTEVYSGNTPKHCEFHLTYTALKTWDMAMYMHHAELQLYNGVKPIAHAEYHLTGGGGLALNKWASVESKMDPVVDNLLAEYSPAIVDSYRQDLAPTKNADGALSKPDQLRELRN